MMENEQKMQVDENQQQTDRVWLLCAGLVTAIATFLRFFWLDLKPLHHDEGVNGFFLTNLVRDGVYKYDPANYHGPTLYYIALPFVKLFGLETIPIRVSVAIFGVLTVVLALYLKRYIGRVGSLFAALFLALSPGMVFISRYSIHEIFFVFLSLGIVVSVLFFIEKRKAGYFGVTWLVVLLLVCVLPAALLLAGYLGGENAWAVWGLRVGFFVIEGFLVYHLIKLLLAWDEGRPIYLLLASACAALLFATKETAFITLGTMVLACASVWVWRRLNETGGYANNRVRVMVAVQAVVILVALYFSDSLKEGGKWLYDNFLGEGKIHEAFVFYSIVFLGVAAIATWIIFLVGLRQSDETAFDEPAELTWRSLRSGLGKRNDLILIIAATSTLFIVIVVVFFSSFFTYADGVGKAFEAYAIWTKTGNKDHTQNTNWAYLKWGMKVESAVLILSALGALIALLKAKHRFAMFTAFWAFGLFAAYSIIPYKTPWLALSFLLPMCIIAGYGIGEMLTSKNMQPKVAAAVLAISGTALLAYQTYDLNFVRYDDEEMAYVYAHTKRRFLVMMSEIARYAEKSGMGKDATIDIVSPDYWPMTWYLNDYRHAYFHGQLVNPSGAEMVVAKKDEQDNAVIQRYSTGYKYAGVYPLRPGVNLVLLVRRDLADSDTQEMYKLLVYKPIADTQ